MPVPVGSTVTARFAKEAEFEGTGYFTAGSVDATTAAGTALKIASGKFAAATVVVPVGGATVSRVHAYLGRLIPPYTTGSFRWTVDFIG